MQLSGQKEVDSLDDCHKVASVKKLDIRTGRLKSACLEYLTFAPNELKGCIFVPKQLCLLERVLQLWLGQSFDFVVA